MNLPQLLTGTLRVLGRSEAWEDCFDLSKSGYRLSFLALILSIPFYYVCAAAVQKQRFIVTGADGAWSLPTTAFIIILGLYALTFVVSAYMLSLVFDKMDRFRAWVIVRHWAIFFSALLSALILGAFLAGWVPFTLAIYAVMGIYLFTLAIDIRLAQRIVGFEWGAAVLTGCLITAMGLTVLLMGVVQYI